MKDNAPSKVIEFQKQTGCGAPVNTACPGAIGMAGQPKQVIPVAEPAFTIVVDKMSIVQSRLNATMAIDMLAREICGKYNIILPKEYMLAYQMFGSPNDTSLKIGFHLITKVKPIHEWLYFKLIKIPVLGKFVRGPKIVSHLMPSMREAEQIEKSMAGSPIGGKQ